jgi:pimeloyl-ACP methyl ester carboxylesterase
MTASDGTALVLVHGGQHDHRCWDPTVDVLRQRAPGVPVVAVDLPGRDGNLQELTDYSVATCVDAAARQVEAAGVHDVVLVAHSAGGIVVPQLAERLGAARVRRMVFLAAFVPPDGGCINDALTGPFAPIARLAVRRTSPSKPLPGPLSAAIFGNGMTPAQRSFMLDRLCSEAAGLGAVRVDRSGMPASIPRTWILTLQDRALSIKQQRGSIARLGGVEEILALDTCHDAMISEPEALADILLARVPSGDRDAAPTRA